MITPTLKEWLKKLFAWWPWKRSTQVEHQHVASSVIRGQPWEKFPQSPNGGTAPQTGVTPRISTLEDWSEGSVQPRAETPDIPPLASPTPCAGTDARFAGEPGEVLHAIPTAQQRLEFLRYLVQRGIVNEGFETHTSDT